MARLASVDFRVCNGGAPQAGEASMTLVGDGVLSLTGAPQRALSEFAGQRVHAVAGIGNPSRFFTMLRVAGIDVIEHAFPDHHAFAASDLVFGDELPVLMTQKDAVKCRAFANADWWSVPVRAHLQPDFFDAVAKRLCVGDQTR
jgi:tetraacyldisaccharide 4'-kinase